MFIPYFVEVSIERKATRRKYILYYNILLAFMKRHLLKLYSSGGRPLEFLYSSGRVFSLGRPDDCECGS